MLRSRLFFDAANLGRRIASPIDYILGAVRALEMLDPAPSTPVLADWCGRLGQDLFYPPNVGGWPGGRNWITTRSALGRANFAAALVGVDSVGLGTSFDPIALAARHGQGRNPSFFAQTAARCRWPRGPARCAGTGPACPRPTAGFTRGPADLSSPLILPGDEIMITRRDFLARGLRNSTLIALAPTLPGFLARTAHAAGPEKDGRILVVVQLDGGNDGINTVVPFKDEGYARYRKAIRLPEKRLIKVSGEVGLHPAMGDAGKLLESGRLAIVPGVGYPNPSRSHFRSMAIWQSARLDERDHTGLGWVGRGLDEGPTTRDGAPAALLIGSDDPPPAIRGRRSVSAALDRLDDYALSDKDAEAKPIGSATAGDDLGQFLRRSLLDAYTTADRLAAVAGGQGRPRVLSRVRTGPAARPHGAVDQGRVGHARLLSRAGRLRHPRPAAPAPRPVAGGALGVAQGVSRRPGGVTAGRPRRSCWSSASSAAASPRTVRWGPTTAPPGRCSWPARASGRGCTGPTRASRTWPTAT